VAKRKKRRKNGKINKKRKKISRFALPREVKQRIWGVVLISLAIIVSLSFFEKAGKAGAIFLRGSRFLIGDVVFLVPLILALGGITLLTSKRHFIIFHQEREIFWPIILAIILLICGTAGILGSINHNKKGGILGNILGLPLLKYFDFWATQVIFLVPIVAGILIFWQFLRFPKEEREQEGQKEVKKPSFIRRVFSSKFKVKEIPSFPSSQQKQIETQRTQAEPVKLKTKNIKETPLSSYQPPPLDLLEKDRGLPTSGDTRINSAIIKKTLQNFGIEVVMSEVNIGPTVTQYTLKPAEGVKLSKITALSNDLALALASHPIRIEAPIPGRALVGIEVPNKVRSQVRLRNLLESPNFQKSPSNLLIALGRDVAGFPVYADLTRMPHLLVAGSTGSGKTIFLNTLILSLLYQPNNSIKSGGPEFLRFILVDPKRVEFPIYNSLPHLLCPVIYNASQTVNALRWLTEEMERRFDVLAEVKARDIGSYNEIAYQKQIEPLPFIVFIIDELADLMAAKGREIEAGIVRLAQMARAVGIHLVVATQRPSVEVITGLIKANITSRITFQVASQVDSRTVIDTSGAEKLLGSGDMLYVSAEVSKPKRIQAPYVSDKEVKKVINYINSNKEKLPEVEMDSTLLQELERATEEPEGAVSGFNGEEDPLYEEAKRVVIEAKRASASLLQRRLRVGYARAARLIDMLEERGIVGPPDGAKPREVYGEREEEEGEKLENFQKIEDNEDGWEKV